ncbi:MAG: lytic transglycosylase domain-containing protein, partial [Actinomycetota bacterium]|nr:lytic transglycosylase domain-containing protein [Actinomycetota bacterium]
MGRIRLALATISVGALLATSQAVAADGAVPVTGSAVGTSPLPDSGTTGGTGTTGSTGTTGATGTTGEDKNKGSNGGSKGNGNKNTGSGNGNKNQGSGKKKPGKNKGSQTVDPANDPESPPEVVPGSEPLHIEMAPNTAIPGGALPGDGTATTACNGTEGPPRNLVPIYIQAAKKYNLGELGPQTLAAINRIETDFGRLNNVTSSAGAIGWMQFMPATWDMYGTDGDGDGKADPYNPRDAIHSAANYLSAAGAPTDWYDAIWAYNHADWYVK